MARRRSPSAGEGFSKPAAGRVPQELYDLDSLVWRNRQAFGGWLSAHLPGLIERRSQVLAYQLTAGGMPRQRHGTALGEWARRHGHMRTDAPDLADTEWLAEVGLQFFRPASLERYRLAVRHQPVGLPGAGL